MNKKENLSELFRCMDSDSSNCNDLNFSFSPNFSFNAKRAKNNAPSRERGTSKQPTDTPGFFYDALPETNNQVAGITKNDTNNEAINSSALNVALNSLPSDNESLTTIDEGGQVREGNNSNIPAVQNDLDEQRVSDQALKIDGGNKAFQYISPLASTNIAGIANINPLDEASNGADGSIYDVKLLEDEGIIYLRQYLSFDDEETGAVWRFQYAPQIAYSRASNFQEDVTWGTNVQPAHFNNTSGKKVTIQGAVLEGMTLGRTVTGAVKALEILMSIVDPDNEDQVAPYAYRLIVGNRTFTEPVSGRHAPFVIENISVKEEMYDTNGEVLKYKVDMSLKEVPYYQINDGRKLLLVTQDQRTRAQASCDQISAELAKLDNQVANREKELLNLLQDIQTRSGGDNSKARSLLKTNINIFSDNCSNDSKAYSEYIEYYKRYKDAKCRTSKPTRGFYIIEELFANDSGVYEILKGRPQLTSSSLFRSNVFNENGVAVPYLETAKTIRERVGSSNPPVQFLKALNDGYTDYGRNNSEVVDAAAYNNKDLMKSCKHIRCVSRNIQASTSDTNLDYVLKAAENMINNPESFNDLFSTGLTDSIIGGVVGKVFVVRIKKEKARIYFPNSKNIIYDDNDIEFLCADSSHATDLGYTNVGRIVKDTRNEVNKIFDKSISALFRIEEKSKFKIPSAQTAACVIQVKNVLKNAVRVSDDENCNKEATLSPLAQQYEGYVKRLETIYKGILKEFLKTGGSSLTESDLIKNLVEKSPCAAYLPTPDGAGGKVKSWLVTENYSDGRYAACRAAYSTVETTKFIIKTLDGNNTIEDPFPNINLA